MFALFSQNLRRESLLNDKARMRIVAAQHRATAKSQRQKNKNKNEGLDSLSLYATWLKTKSGSGTRGSCSVRVAQKAKGSRELCMRREGSIRGRSS